MKRKAVVMSALMMVVLLIAGLTVAEGAKKKSKGPSNVLYVCSCGDECACKKVFTKPGKCACGKKTVAMHILKIEGDEALLCTCGKGCTCKLNPDDPTKCGCGKPVKRVSLKGLYVCGCTDNCTCNTVSDKPGKCKCGTEMRKVE
ncbi:MAG: hypothetical protein HQK92_03015 [Nitrospirae bacterium]|nr:hypothetical protein [Nitrospirota bacterium]